MSEISRDIAKGERRSAKRVRLMADEIAQMGQYFSEFIEKFAAHDQESGHVTDKVASASVELSATAEEISKGHRYLDVACITNRCRGGRDERHGRTGCAEFREGRQPGAGHGQDRARRWNGGVGTIPACNSCPRRCRTRRPSSRSWQVVRSNRRNRPHDRDIADQTNLLVERRDRSEHERTRTMDSPSWLMKSGSSPRADDKATKEIGDMIRQIQQDTRGAVDSMQQGTQKVTAGVDLVNKTGEALSQIVQMVSESADMIRQIAVASEEQSVATQQIASGIENVAKGQMVVFVRGA